MSRTSIFDQEKYFKYFIYYFLNDSDEGISTQKMFKEIPSIKSTKARSMDLKRLDSLGLIKFARTPFSRGRAGKDSFRRINWNKLEEYILMYHFPEHIFLIYNMPNFNPPNLLKHLKIFVEFYNKKNFMTSNGYFIEGSIIDLLFSNRNFEINSMNKLFELFVEYYISVCMLVKK